MAFLYISIALVVLLVLSYCLLCSFCGGIAFLRQLRIIKKNEKNEGYESDDEKSKYKQQIKEGEIWFNSMPFESVYVDSFDGLRLYGRFLKNPEEKGIILLFHGYRCKDGVRDFSCVLRYYYELGLSILCVDQRSHGKSEGKYISFGVLERHDCISWINYINKRTNSSSKLFLAGISMGCATVLMASGLGLPKNVRGIIADCGFTSPREIVRIVGERIYRHSMGWILWGMNLYSKFFAHFGIKDCSTVEAVKNSKTPTLFIHGKADTFVPCDMTIKNYNACAAEKKLLLVEGAGHAMSYLLDTQRCQRELKEFIYGHM